MIPHAAAISNHGDIDSRRVKILRAGVRKRGPVLYWMSRDQRVLDNWALLFSQKLALSQRAPLVVVFCLVPEFLGATIRQYDFMLKGLQEVEERLLEKQISFFLRSGAPEQTVPALAKHLDASAVVNDFDPLKIKRSWKKIVANKLEVPLYEVDAHNIVPCWLASPKQEYGAYTFRPKIVRALPEFLTEFPKLRRHPYPLDTHTSATDWASLEKTLAVDRSVPKVNWITSGEKSARIALRRFLKHRLAHYSAFRNDPTHNAQSDLSPYLHFGQLSAQRVALEVQKYDAPIQAQKAFLEELVVRRELSDNYCFYNPHYDSCAGFPAWARATLDAHRNDPRQYRYSLELLEQSRTHDTLWNACQRQMALSGKMHGYLRMYWAKKILEWSTSPEVALKSAIYLNDKYELDGRDPNGYTGIAWCIGGVHDRAWSERDIFGKIRYMSSRGMKSKFDVGAYETQYGASGSISRNDARGETNPVVFR